MPSCVG